MRKRPRSSVTTSLANFVGRSVVSAIPQTPASGPLGPVTTPPMSPAAALPVPWVLKQAVRSAARTAAAAPRYRILLVFMNPPLDCDRPRDESPGFYRTPALAGELRVSGHQDARFHPRR